MKHVFIDVMRWRRLSLTCLETFLLLVTLCVLTSVVHVAFATTRNVPQDYATIQEAIDAATAGDTIQVNRRSGESQSIYYERLVVDKQLTLVGESREAVVIDGSGGGTVVLVRADSVEIRGFTIRNAGQQYTGIRASGYYYVTVANNTIETNKYGVYLYDSDEHTVVHNILYNNSAVGISLSESLGNTINENHVSESAYGIKMYSTNVTFVNANTIEDTSYGIYLEYSSNDTLDGNTLLRNGVSGIFPHASYDIIISDNEIAESAYAIELHSVDTTTILRNNATGNNYGIYLAYSGSSNIIENNTISQNDWGIKLYSSSSNTFMGNKLSHNTYGVDSAVDSNGNLFYHNNFMVNSEQVIWNPNCVNTWDDGAEGNYWSDYTGSDSNGDGIGDTAYTIDPMNKDRRPLMTPWGFFHDVAIVGVAVSANKAYVGEIVNITVTAQNPGSYTESFSVTVTYENVTLAISGTVDTQDVIDLASEEAIELIFSWNTTDVQPCVNYTIIAEASTVDGETDFANNTYVDGTVKVKIPGDINGDGVVDVLDLSIVAEAYGTRVGRPKYNPDADLNADGIVDLRDLAVVCANYGNTCT